MSQTLSPSSARCFGLARVARVWTVARASVYRSLKETPPNTIARRPGPVGVDLPRFRGEVRSWDQGIWFDGILSSSFE